MNDLILQWPKFGIDILSEARDNDGMIWSNCEDARIFWR